MAKERRSLFERLTGSVNTNEEYEFEDLAGQTPSKAILEREEEPQGELTVDVYQTPTHIIIKAMIAGVRPEDLDISITRDMVTLKGKREQHTEVQSGEYFFQELYWGAFSRTIVLPQEVEIEEAEATEKHGLLVIRLPKVDKGRQTKLKVKSS